MKYLLAFLILTGCVAHPAPPVRHHKTKSGGPVSSKEATKRIGEVNDQMKDMARKP